MIERIIEWCGRNRTLTIAAALLATFGGAWAAARTPLDAVPDLSDTQVIVFTKWMGRGPTLVEDQITYPITTTFLAAPKVKAVRGFTMCTIEGRERYTINVRYPRELRDDVDQLARVLVPTPDGAQIPLAQLGRFQATIGPPMIKSEAGSLVGWVYVDVEGRDIGGYVRDAKDAVAASVELPAGYRLSWTGQYEFLERIRARLQIVLPLTLAIVFAILTLNFGGAAQALLVMTAVPLSLVGSIWLMAALGYNTSIAAYVGMIALIGVAAETASVMVVYLDETYVRWRAEGRLRGPVDLVEMGLEAAVPRIRAIAMAVGMNIFGLVPIMLSQGTGADVAKRIASPMQGGLVSLIVMTLFVIPAAYLVWRGGQLRKTWRETSPSLA